MDKKIGDKILAVFSLVLPIVVLFVLIGYYGINVVCTDEWELVYLYDDIISDGFSFGKLFAQHNEHRIFFPRIVLLLSYFLTGWNTKAVMYINACFLSITYLFLAKGASGKRRIVDFARKDMLFALLLGLCMMSACQWQNLLWGFQLAWFLIEMSVVCSLVFFSKYLNEGGIQYWFISTLFATVSVYSSLQGVAVWPMYAVLFLVVGFTRRNWAEWKRWVLSAIVGITEIILYFYDYSSVAWHGQYQSSDIGECLSFMMKQLGYVFCDSNEMIAVILGIILTGIAVCQIVYLVYKKKADQYILPLGMIIFGMGVILMISVGRGNLMLASRYTTYSLMVLSGELFVFYKEMNQDIGKWQLNMDLMWIVTVIEGMLMALCIVESLDSLQMCSSIKTERATMRETLQNYQDVPLEALQQTYPWKNYEQAYDTIQLLENKKWNVWKNDNLLYKLADIEQIELSKQSFDSCSMDFVTWDKQFRVLSMAGWAVDGVSMQEYSNLYININDKHYTCKDHLERADVAEYFDNEAFAHSGFSFSKSVDVLSEGVNEISIFMVAKDRRTAYASQNVYIYYSKESGIYRCDQDGNRIGD